MTIVKYQPQTKTTAVDKIEEVQDVFADLFADLEQKLYVDEIPEDAKNGNAIFANGTFDIITNDIGRFIVKSKKGEGFPYLKNKGEQSFTMLLPKIPANLLYGTYDFFKKIAETNSNEVMVQIFWNKQNQEYELHVPEQEVAGASISFKRNEGAMIDPNLLWAMDIHSHVNMNAFWSATDSADEVSTRMFGVIGKLNSPGLTMCLRAGHGGSFIDLSLGDIFDTDHFDENETDRYVVPEEDYLKVKEKAATVYGKKPTGTGVKSQGVLYDGDDTGYSWYNNNSWNSATHNYHTLGETGYKKGNYGYSLKLRFDGYTEADIIATRDLDILINCGNLLRAKYMLSETTDDNESQSVKLLASRIVCEFVNCTDFKESMKKAFETFFALSISNSDTLVESGEPSSYGHCAQDVIDAFAEIAFKYKDEIENAVLLEKAGNPAAVEKK